MISRFQRIIIQIAFIVIGLFQLACECVPGLNTPKVIDPSVSANIAFVHSLPDIGSLYPKTNNNVFNEINYTSYNISYNKLAVYDIITLENSNKNILYRQVVELRQNAFYTIIFYGIGNRIREILLDDSVRKTDGENSFVRFVHTGINTGAVAFKLNDSIVTNIMTYGSYTEFKEIEPGKYSVNAFNIVNDSLIASISDFTFSDKQKYLVILKGYLIGNSSRPLECKALKYVQ